MTKKQRCRQALEAAIPNHPPLFNTIGNPNSYQTVLLTETGIKFSTNLIQRALTAMGGNQSLKRKLELDPNGGIHPRTTAQVASPNDKYDDGNLRYGVQKATSRIIHEVDFGLLPAHQSGACSVSDAKVAVAVKLSKISKVLHKMDDVPTLVNTIQTAQAGVTDILEVLEEADVDTDAFLTGLGLSQTDIEMILGINNNDDAVTVP